MSILGQWQLKLHQQVTEAALQQLKLVSLELAELLPSKLMDYHPEFDLTSRALYNLIM